MTIISGAFDVRMFAKVKIAFVADFSAASKRRYYRKAKINHCFYYVPIDTLTDMITFDDEVEGKMESALLVISHLSRFRSI